MGLESDQIDIARRENTRMLADRVGSQAAFAELIERTPGQVNHWIGKNPTKNIGKTIARHIERCFDLPMHWLDTPHSAPPVAIGSHSVTEPGARYEAQQRASAALLDQLDENSLTEWIILSLKDLSPRHRTMIAKAALSDLPEDAPL